MGLNKAAFLLMLPLNCHLLPRAQTSVVDINAAVLGLETEALAASFITNKGLVSGKLKSGQTDSEKLDHDSLAQWQVFSW